MKLELDKELSRLNWYEQRIETINDDRYSINDTWDIDKVKESIQRNVDQGATESFNDVADNQWHGIPWVVVNGVTRRYGYTK
jgi:hypothetical protein